MNRSEDESRFQRESLSLQIPKKKGEATIRLLTKLSLLNRRLAPRAADEMLHVPLSREPKPEERKQLEKIVGEQILTQERFATRSLSVGSLEELLSGTLPSSVIPLVSKSFDVIGDLAIIELSPTAEPFERSIAEAVMKVHKNVKAVYSKAGAITGNERVRPLHHILGAKRTETIHKEQGCRFKVDVSKAYFSPRLSTEHKTVAEQVRPGECVVDMFAGVGPFSIMIAKRQSDVEIHAIDANPDAAELITENAKLNKVQDRIRVWAGDSSAVVKDNLKGTSTRVIMNHPSQARRFLEPACEALRREGGIIHYYTFADGLDSELKASKELANALDDSAWKIKKIIETRKVRGVAPMRWQIAVDALLAPAKALSRVRPELSG